MGDQVIVETAAGMEFATCTEGNHEVEDAAIVKPLSPVVRMATDNDRRTVEHNKKKEREAFDICEEEDRVTTAWRSVGQRLRADGNKIIAALHRRRAVDFRELVRPGRRVRAWIELRQIGVGTRPR